MEYVMLKDVCAINMGQSPDSDSYNNNGEGVPFFQGNADFGERYPVVRKWCSAPTKMAAPEDILISVRAPIGAMNYAKEECCIGRGLAALTPDRTKVSPEFLFWLLKEKNTELNSKGTGSTFKAIGKKVLEETMIPNIPIEKQLEYSEALEKVHAIIQMRKKEIQHLDDLIKARFVEMFGSIHDGRFDMKTLLEIVNDDKNSIKRGPFGGALKKEDFVEDGYLVYEQRHAIHNDFEYAKYYITQEKYEGMIGFKVVPGDLIISCSGVTLGRIAEVPEGAKEGIINQALLKLSLNPHIMMNTFFIQQFRGEEIQNILFGFSRGSGIPNMPSMSEVKAVKFICPPLELQKEYCDFVHQVDKSKVVVQKALDETQILFNSLMQQYFG
nr:MAG TPA: hypothetical protein [Caudoviricetes sp.]